MFLARVEWLPVTSRSHSLTDKCKISIVIYSVDVDMKHFRIVILSMKQSLQWMTQRIYGSPFMCLYIDIGMNAMNEMAAVFV